MYRKLMIAMCAAVLLSLLGSGPTFASKGVPTWETVFDPGAYMPGSFYMISAVEEYKGNLYAAAGDPGWFGEEWPRESGGQLFRSPDGKNWEPATELGFGLGTTEGWCGDQNYYDLSLDMIVFQDQLYILPLEDCYITPGVVLRSSDGETWESVVTVEEFGLTWPDWDGTPLFGQFHKLIEYQGMLYVSADYADPMVNNFTESAIFRSPTGDPGTWEEVKKFPGWGWPGSFHIFKGALYLASDGVYLPPDGEPVPEQIWRSYDGLNWEMVVGDGFGNSGSDGLGGFADYKGYLYVGVATYEGGGGQIWRSQTGDVGSWEAVITDGFGNPDDDKIDGLVVYLGDLYAYTVNWMEGGRVFRTKDAITWEQVSDPGWGNATYFTTQHNNDQVVFKDDLYVGVIGEQGVLLKLAHPSK